MSLISSTFGELYFLRFVVCLREDSSLVTRMVELLETVMMDSL